jgi:hypothetical protein
MAHRTGSASGIACQYQRAFRRARLRISDILVFRPAFRPGALSGKCYINLAVNAAIAAGGVALCVATVYPTFNDGIQANYGDQSVIVVALQSVILLCANFDALFPMPLVSILMPGVENSLSYQAFIATALPLLLYGSTLGLVKRPAAMIGEGCRAS